MSVEGTDRWMVPALLLSPFPRAPIYLSRETYETFITAGAGKGFVGFVDSPNGRPASEGISRAVISTQTQANHQHGIAMTDS